MSKNLISKKRHIVLLVETRMGNPNGSPDHANMPRIDHQTNIGYISSGSVKRKWRDRILLRAKCGDLDRSKNDIFIREEEKWTFEEAQEQIYQALGQGQPKKGEKNAIEKARQKLCSKYIDLRLFGGVNSGTSWPCGKTHGPVQVLHGISVDPVMIEEYTLTRSMYTRDEKAETTSSDTEMGNKYFVPYVLHRILVEVDANRADDSGATEEDYEVLLEAMENMFEDNSSDSSGERNVRGIFIFTHESKMGNCQKKKLFDSIKVRRKEGVEFARRFDDYEVEFPKILPEGVTLEVREFDLPPR